MRSLFCFKEVGQQQSFAHMHTLCLYVSLAWRGYVARQNLKQMKKEQEEAAICIQSGKEIFMWTSESSHAAQCRVEICVFSKRARIKALKPYIFVKHLFDLQEWPAK